MLMRIVYANLAVFTFCVICVALQVPPPSLFPFLAAWFAVVVLFIAF